MPIDDDIIDAKMASLNTKIRTLNSQRQDLELIQERLKQVRSIEVFPIKSGDPPTKEIPIDSQTGLKFTTQRRQAIYDQGVQDADAALV
ncbi:MAG TPA: hypothetical protein ENH82_00275 [bacterium]|nr:hypothetical protein [bacterium]